MYRVYSKEGDSLLNYLGKSELSFYFRNHLSRDILITYNMTRNQTPEILKSCVIAFCQETNSKMEISVQGV